MSIYYEVVNGVNIRVVTVGDVTARYYKFVDNVTEVRVDSSDPDRENDEIIEHSLIATISNKKFTFLDVPIAQRGGATNAVDYFDNLIALEGFGASNVNASVNIPPIEIGDDDLTPVNINIPNYQANLGNRDYGILGFRVKDTPQNTDNRYGTLSTFGKRGTLSSIIYTMSIYEFDRGTLPLGGESWTSISPNMEVLEYDRQSGYQITIPATAINVAGYSLGTATGLLVERREKLDPSKEYVTVCTTTFNNTDIYLSQTFLQNLN